MSMAKQNRPTDPFGGPPRRNNISLVLVLAALAFFAVLQWTARNGNQETTATATVAALASPTVVEATAVDATAVEVVDAPDEDEVAVIPTATTAAPAAASDAQPRGVETAAAPDPPTPTANAPPAPTRASDLPSILYADLPVEAHNTIALIETDGPFPFSRDGVTFQNRERLLPRHPEGYYREYTVITPGASNRGARRIVTGTGGEMYYTDDHYASFSEIIR